MAAWQPVPEERYDSIRRDPARRRGHTAVTDRSHPQPHSRQFLAGNVRRKLQSWMPVVSGLGHLGDTVFDIEICRFADVPNFVITSRTFSEWRVIRSRFTFGAVFGFNRKTPWSPSTSAPGRSDLLCCAQHNGLCLANATAHPCDSTSPRYEVRSRR